MKLEIRHLLQILPLFLIVACCTAGTLDTLSNRNFVPVLDLDSLIADTLGIPAKQAEKRLNSASSSTANVHNTVRDSTAKTDTVTKSTSSGIVFNSGLKGDRGILRGLVLSVDGAKPIADVSINLQRDTIRLSTSTDAAGLYRIVGIPPGVWKITILRKGYETKLMDAESVTAGEDRVMEIQLERKILKGQLVQATSGRKAGSSQDILTKRKQAAAVMEGVSAEKIAKTTDSDAGAIARRITGTSLVGGKYIYVRGLGERYTNMTLNGLPVPSPEKDKRVVPQDLFPAGALESFSIYKTFVPDLYSDFAGGSVALVTKGIPEKSFFKVSLSTSNYYHGRLDSANYLTAYREEAPKNGLAPEARPAGWIVGDRRLTYNGGNTFWGFDDGTRSLPKGFPGSIPRGLSETAAQEARNKGLPGYSTNERIQLANELSNVYAIDTAKIKSPTNFTISGGSVFPAPGDGKFGYLATLGFKNKYDQNLVEKQDVVLANAYVDVSEFNTRLQMNVVRRAQLFDTVQSDSGPVAVPVSSLQPGITAQNDQGTYEAQLTGMLNMRYENPNWAVWWKNFAINLGTDHANITHSYVSPRAGGQVTGQGSPYEERSLLEFNRRDLICSQVGGEAYVGKGLMDSVTWAAGLSNVTGETPDSRRYIYSQSVVKPEQAFEFRNTDVWGTRIYESLDEVAAAARVDAMLIIPPEYASRDTFFLEGQIFSHLALPTFTTGLAWNGRKRHFNATRYAYNDARSLTGLKLEQIRAPDSLSRDITEGVSDFSTGPKDYDTYNASEIQAASYLASSISARLWDIPLGLDGGVRAEWYNFKLRAPYTGINEGQPDKKIKIGEWAAYPTVGIWIQPTRPLKLRLQYAQTAVRPEIREVAPTAFADFTSGRTILGNPDLQKTRVIHYDTRADLYLPFQQTISVSLFYKDFTKPVETSVDIDKIESQQNAQGAYVKGVEFEAVINPGHLLDGLDLSLAWLQGLEISGNLALMQSEVSLRKESSGVNTSKRRPMVGQAPYLINLSLTHEAEAGPFAFLNAVLFNLAGERIHIAGTQGLPDITEKPYASLESLHRFTFWKRTELSVRVKNWLRQSKEFRVKEYNDKLIYHTLTPEQYQATFGKVERYLTLERTQEGLSVEVNLSCQL